ncbi:hypothetical protein QJ48_30470 [Paenibacillus sp. A3]|uniref:recombinase family protein n=1 Tax=Paenibacillus sp. A3 TaxID=1337054 RepID=UPI0006D59FF9|nr:recombinase family protein [Paenibacillus sp. A3]KPV55917.1 hypothetical protein QJ48_30470 [Paenibacillus sp. A3]
MNEIKQVAIYLRLSRDEEGVGIEKILANHRKKLIELCKQKKWKYTIYEEIASSQDFDRPQLNAMLDEIKNKTYDAVVVHAVAILFLLLY